MNFNIQKIDQFTGHKDCVYTLEHTNTPGGFLSAGGDGLLVAWNTQFPDLGKPIAKIPNSVYALLHIKEQNELWIGNNYEGIHRINTLNNAQSGSLKLGKQAFFDIKTWGQNLFVAENTGRIVVIDKERLCIKKHLHASEKSARTMAINPKYGELAVGYSDHSIKIFDIDTLQLKKNWVAHKQSVFSLLYSEDHERLISGGRDAHLKIWEVDNQYGLAHDIPAHLFAINHLAALPEHSLIATCSMDKTIKLWDAKTLKLLKVIDKARHAGHGTSINKILWLPENQTLLSASDDRTISMWKLF
jgi:WD40 repeat protein